MLKQLTLLLAAWLCLARCSHALGAGPTGAAFSPLPPLPSANQSARSLSFLSFNAHQKQQQQQVAADKPLDSSLLGALERIAGADLPARKQVNSLPGDQDSFGANGRLTTADLLRRAGFHFELHNSTSLDGYLTQLVRIVNPKADRANLKRPPVVLYAGQGASPAVFLLPASRARSQPLEWPRGEHHWPAAGGAQASDGRGQVNGGTAREESDEQQASGSLALTLANNGYDVWLVPARGVDEANRSRVGLQAAGAGAATGNSSSGQHDQTATGKVLETFRTRLRSLAVGAGTKSAAAAAVTAPRQQYWSFSDDELIEYEFGRQLELVLQLTKRQRLSLISYSNGGLITFAFMANWPEFARRHLDLVVAIAPAVFVDRHNLVLGASGFLSQLTPPNRAYPSELARAGLLQACSLKNLRYPLCKLLLDQLYGHSDPFSVHPLESRGLLEFMGRPMSARSLRQTLQAARSGQLRHYDFGPLGNLLAYEGQLRAPRYNLAAIKHERMILISGGKDSIVSDRSIGRLISELDCKPEKWINIPGYNHLDLLAGHDNIERVNLPILRLLDDRSLELDYYHDDDEKGDDKGDHRGDEGEDGGYDDDNEGDFAGQGNDAVQAHESEQKDGGREMTPAAPPTNARADSKGFELDEGENINQQGEPRTELEMLSGARAGNRTPFRLMSHQSGGGGGGGNQMSRYDGQTHTKSQRRPTAASAAPLPRRGPHDQQQQVQWKRPGGPVAGSAGVHPSGKLNRAEGRHSAVAAAQHHSQSIS